MKVLKCRVPTGTCPVGFLPSGSGCILDVWLTRKTGNITSMATGYWLHRWQRSRDTRTGQHKLEAPAGPQIRGTKATFAGVQGLGLGDRRGTMVGVSCEGPNHQGEPALPEIEGRNPLTCPCAHWSVTDVCHCCTQHPGRNNQAEEPWKACHRADSPLPEAGQGKGKAKNGRGTNRPSQAQWTCLDPFFFTFNHNDFTSPGARPWQIYHKPQKATGMDSGVNFCLMFSPAS